MEPSWHGSVGWTFTARDGTYCGYVGSCYLCDSREDTDGARQLSGCHDHESPTSS